MEFYASHQPYLIAQQIGDPQCIPFLALDMKNDTCIPQRKVFQILHKHEEIEFILVLENKLRIQTPMSDITIEAGQGAFIPKNVLHVLDTFGNCSCRGFLFPDTLLLPSTYLDLYSFITDYTDNPLMDLVLIDQNETESDIIEKLILLDKIAFQIPKTTHHEFKLISAIHDLWFSFVSTIDINSRSVHADQKSKGDRLKKYLEFIQLNYTHSISIKDIANSGYTSISECNRIFKSMLDITAYEYLIQFRINKSLSLIKDRQLSIEKIAYQVGYNSPSQFTKYFKKHMGTTPTQYMKQ